jgi:hypothetical protein
VIQLGVVSVSLLSRGYLLRIPGAVSLRAAVAVHSRSLCLVDDHRRHLGKGSFGKSKLWRSRGSGTAGYRRESQSRRRRRRASPVARLPRLSQRSENVIITRQGDSCYAGGLALPLSSRDARRPEITPSLAAFASVRSLARCARYASIRVGSSRPSSRSRITTSP